MSDERDFEKEARLQGWKPEDEWNGEPPADGFKTAEQFVNDGADRPGRVELRKEISH